MASFTFKQLQRTQFSSFSHCKYSSTLNAFQFPLSFQALSFSPPKHSLNSGITSFLQVKAHVAPYLEKRLSEEELSTDNNINTFPSDDISSGFSSSTSIHRRAGRIFLEKNLSGEENVDRKLVLRDRLAKNGLNSKRKKQVSSGVSAMKFTNEKLVKNNEKTDTLKDVNEGTDKIFMKCENKLLKAEKKEKRTKTSKVDPSGASLKVGLDLCSKTGDVMGAIRLYDLSKKEGIKMGEYHHAVLLYLCSSAATGMVQPAKSGSASRSLIHGDPSKKDRVADSEALNKFGKVERRKSNTASKLFVQDANENPLIEHSGRNESNLDGFPAGVALGDSNYCFDREDDPRKNFNRSMEVYPENLNGLVQSIKRNADSLKIKDDEGEGGKVEVSDDVKRFALQKGFEIFNEMCREKVPMNEATFTSVARMAMAFGDGDMAFDMVKQMKEYGLNPRLRSYGPALTIFCNNGDVEKAFMVEEHMIRHGVHSEEPELEMLLKVSIEAGKSDKVYYVLHKLRTNVRQVSPSTANLIERWFKSKVASRVGKKKWDHKLIVQAIENGGGGWHGKGWLGKGKWTVCHSFVGSDGLCKCCGEKLVTIDLDPAETENFAKSVASIASQREKNSSFQKFQKWLEYYGPFDAVVDGANVGLYSQRRLKPSKVNAVVNGIRQMLPSRKWPLIILHNRRITGEKMDEPVNRKIIEKWKNADALYATPTGSNDDWYWLYAAIKYRCLLVTNDEMRDHLFLLLGNDFFPKWKERHQVHFSFDETGPVFHMPPPYSVVIQESEKGHWHIPIVSELEQEDQRIWLCCTRAGSRLREQDSEDLHEESHHQKGEARLGSREQLQELCSTIETTVIPSLMVNHQSILQQLEAAEKLGTCLIDFQI